MKLKFSNATKESWWKQELYGAQEPSLETGRMPPPMPWHVPWGLAWCPRVEPRHVTRANIRASTRATGPCLVPASQAKTHDARHGALHGPHESSHDIRRVPPRLQWHVPRGLAWCPLAEPRRGMHSTARAMTRATGPCMVPTSRAKTQDACHLPCHDNYNDPRHGARGCARTRDPCHDSCHDLDAMVPHPEARHVSRATARATTLVMTHSMVVEGVPRHVARAMVRVVSSFRPWCLDKVWSYGLLLVTVCY